MSGSAVGKYFNMLCCGSLHEMNYMFRWVCKRVEDAPKIGIPNG